MAPGRGRLPPWLLPLLIPLLLRPPPVLAGPTRPLLDRQLGAAASPADQALEDAPLESQQGILLPDLDQEACAVRGGRPTLRRSSGELDVPDLNEAGARARSKPWPRPAAAADSLELEAGQPAPPPQPPPGPGPGLGLGHASRPRRLPRYRTRKLPLDRRRKLKVLRREPLGRPLADQPEVYVVDETVTGYAAEAPLAGGSELAELDELGQLAPHPHPHLHGPPPPPQLPHDAALLAGGWLEDDDALHVHHRLQKLDFYFSLLRVLSEDCRQRVLCEVAREPDRYSPLAAVLGEVTSFTGSYQYVTSHLINTTEGARLLSYMEASFRGQDRARSCAVFQYRCPTRTEDMINYDALCLWREMVRWLTIHVVARPP